MMFDWIAAILELSGVWKLGNKKKIGFLLSAACNATWMIVALITTPKLFGLLFLVIVLFFLNIRNYIKWKKEEIKTSELDKEN
jgi:hypothetical protein